MSAKLVTPAAKPAPPTSARPEEKSPAKQSVPLHRTYGLTIKIIQGKELIKADLLGKADPYVNISVDEAGKEREKKTSVKSKTLAPEWNETYAFVFEKVPEKLKLSVFDRDRFSKDEFMGEVIIPIGQEYYAEGKKKVFDDWVKLDKVKSGQLKICVEGTVVKSVVGRTERELALPSLEDVTHLFKLTVVKAEGLPHSKWEKCDAFCLVTFGLHVFQTKVKPNNESPSWNQYCPIWFTKDMKDVILKLQVYDKDMEKGAKDEFLGAAFVKPSLFSDGKAHDISLPLGKKNPTTDAELSAVLRDVKAGKDGDGVKGERGNLHIRIELAPRAQVEAEFYEYLCQEYDLDKDGKFSPAEIIHMCDTIGSKKTHKEIQKIFEEADDDKSGYIDKDELKKLLTSHAFQHEGLVQTLHVAMQYGQDGVEHLMSRGLFNNEVAVYGTKFDDVPSIDNEENQIWVRDRKTSQVVHENIPAYIKSAMRLAYQTKGGQKFMSSERISNILAQMSKFQGKKMDTPHSAEKIRDFISLHKLDVDEILLPLTEFKTFNEFFYRRLKPGARLCPTLADPSVAVSPADCRLMVFQTIDDAKNLWIKGQGFSVGNTFASWDPEGRKAAQYTGGSLVIARLAPQDYHRWHWPVTGIAGKRHMIQGEYNTVNPIAIRRNVDVYTHNKRCVCPIETKEFGTVVLIAVGAAMVGTIKFENDDDTDRKVTKFDPHGYFAFGGSTVLIFFKPGTIVFDKDILANSNQKLETLIQVGDRIGTAISE